MPANKSFFNPVEKGIKSFTLKIILKEERHTSKK